MHTVRDHLARQDGWVLNHTPYEQVLAIDASEGARDRAGAYLRELQHRSDGGDRYDKRRFNAFYSGIRGRFPAVFSEFALTW